MPSTTLSVLLLSIALLHPVTATDDLAVIVVAGTEALPGPSCTDEAAQSPRLQWYRNSVFYRMILLQVSITLASGPQTPLLGMRAAQEGIPTSTMGLVLAPTPLACMLVSPWIGLHLPGLGLRRTLLAGAATVALAGLGFGVLGSVSDPHLFIGVAVGLRAASGVGHAAYWTANIAYWNTACDQFSTVQSVTSACSAVVGMLIPPACTLLYAHFGYSVPFLTFGGAAAVVVALCAATLPCQDLGAATIVCPPSRREGLAILRQLPRAAAALLVVTTSMMIEAQLDVLIPYVFAALGVRSVDISWVFSGKAVSWTAASMLSSHMMDAGAYRPAPLVRLYALLGVMGLLALALFRTPGVVALTVLMIDFCMSSATNAASNLMMTETLAYDTALVPLLTGFKVAGGTFGDAFGGSFGGVLYSRTSLMTTAITFATISAVSVAVFVMTAALPSKTGPDATVPLLDKKATDGVLGRIWARIFPSDHTGIV